MQMKKITAPDMRRALQIVKEELGPDALILSNRKVAGGIELVCSIETADEAVPDQPQPSPLSEAASREQQGLATRAASFKQRLRDSREQQLDQRTGALGFQSDMAVAPEFGIETMDEEPANNRYLDALQQTESSQRTAMGVSPEVENLRSEMADMRHLLEQQMQRFGWQRFKDTQPVRAEVWKRLKRLGFASEVIKTCLADCDFERMTLKAAWQAGLHRVISALAVPDQDAVMAGGVHAFVGPTGVGKTTTIAKLAAKYVLAHGKHDIALITMDTYRIAAHEQLKAIGRILDVPVQVVENPEALPAMLSALSHKKLVLIDTGGLNAYEDAHQQQIAALNAVAKPIKTWLLLNATMQYPVMKKSCDEFAKASLSGCILTKLDEALSLGEAVSAALQANLPLAYVTDGPQIPDDVHHLTAKRMMQRVLQRTPFTLTDEDLAEEFDGMDEIQTYSAVS